MYSTDLIDFSHSLRVMFVSCIECDKEHALDLLNIYFSNIDVVDTKKEALEHFAQNRYDVIIAGIKIPEIEDGISLIESIRDISKDITILSIASDLNTFHFTKLIELGIDGFIIKPLYIKQFSQIIHKVLEKIKNKEDSYHYKINLENKVKEQVEKLRQNDKILVQQSKLAAMGEMIDAVAHQWKQPLTIIKMNTDLLEFDYDDDLINKNYIMNFKTKTLNHIDHMTNTLDEFRSFFRPDKETKPFSISSVIDKALLLMKDEIQKNVITINKEVETDIILDGIENEFKHVILNLISNAKDAFKQNKIEQKEITFKLFKENQNSILEIKDNAGGIPVNIINDIFKVNVTSKEDIGGTGIGLYLAKQIVEKHHATINVRNIINGSCFTITIGEL